MSLGLLSPGKQKGPRTEASREAKEVLRTPPAWGRPACQAGTPQQPKEQLLLRGSAALEARQAGTSTQNTCLPSTLGKFKERILHLSSYHVHIQKSVSLSGRLCLQPR